MSPEEVPQELVDMLHVSPSREFLVRAALAPILARYDELKFEAAANYSRRTYKTRELIQQVPCPVCTAQAKPGSAGRCKAPGGSATPVPHYPRREAAIKAEKYIPE